MEQGKRDEQARVEAEKKELSEMALGTFFKGTGSGTGAGAVAGASTAAGGIAVAGGGGGGRIHARIDGDGGLKTSG